jgi:hypothetical protein
MTIDWFDLLIPVPVTAVFVMLSWSVCRGINRGGALSSLQKSLLGYTSLFILGSAYSMGIVGALRLSKSSWIAPTIAWGLLLAFIAWQRHRGRPRNPLS